MKQNIITLAALGLLTVSASAVDTKTCAGCHGANFEKAALGKSKIVKDMSKADIEKALKGYKDGSYGGVMKGTMKGQVAKLSDDDIKAIAEKFGGEGSATKSEDNATKSEDNATKSAPAKEVNVSACAGCHGKEFEKAALGKSKIVKDLSKADIEKALKGYKDGSYGGAMKGTMKGQVAKLSDDDIKAIAEKFGGEGSATKSEDNATKSEDNATKSAPAKEVNVSACAGCHGKEFEKAALGKSKIVKDLSKADIEKALKGYKDGSYGGAMKGVMKGQVAKLSDDDIKAIAEKFGK